MKELRVLGIDENGLGPLLGPLVVTGALLKFKNTADSWFHDIADSKLFFKTRSISHFSLIEETAIAVFFLLKKKMPCSPAEIFSEFTKNAECPLRINICTDKMPANFLWADSDKAKKRCSDFAAWAEINRIEMESVYSDFICPMSLNKFTETNSKLFLDFLSFCKIIKAVRQKNNLAVQAGKIGGLKFYGPYLNYVMDGYDIKIVSEQNAVSIYSLGQNRIKFRLGFFMDVEKQSFPAAVSSIAGKYIRELSMFSIRAHLNIKEDISGYHDRKTKKHIKDITLGGIPQECVFRGK